MLHNDGGLPLLLDQFLKDHQSLQSEMKIIDDCLTNLERSVQISYEDMKELVLPVKHFYEQLEAHLLSEEKELFPLLLNETEEHGYLYFTFDLEHKQIKQYIKQFLFMAERYHERTVEIKKANVLISLRFALEAVTAHFIREEENLFPEILTLHEKLV
ncbi:hemerythrin domain-containing protein [Thalassobacillus devorans]|uniref:hemerythrin domain-containing protein n=1 Tax=Thalassobacillus devorans TaxID=279813 RepID=UPI000A1CCB67|nr:hemerythrin domain-containing protein [Thalassobacillus devorans]